MAHDVASIPNSTDRIGILAGWGRYPIVIAQALRARGIRVICLGIKGHCHPALEVASDVYQEVGMAKVGAAIRFFRRHHVQQATMAGKIHKRLIFEPRALFTHLCPDWRAVKAFIPHYVTLRKDRKDDTMTITIINEFAKDGIEFGPATDYLPELLIEPGQLAGRPLSYAQRKDVEFGWQLAKEMGRLDVGQSVAVKGRAALASEAVEGTDECIRRAGSLCRQGGFTVVKVAKPQQDMRFDVPTIGSNTMESLAAAGGKLLAIEARKTIVIDRDEVIALAKKHGIKIVQFTAEEMNAAISPAA